MHSPHTYTQTTAFFVALGAALVAAALVLLLYALLQYRSRAILCVTLDEHDFLRLQYAWLIIQAKCSLAGTLPSGWAAEPKADFMTFAGSLNQQRAGSSL